MFLHFLWFEIKYRLHRVSTYVYFTIWFFMTFFAVAATNFGPIGAGKVTLSGLPPGAAVTIEASTAAEQGRTSHATVDASGKLVVALPARSVVSVR